MQASEVTLIPLRHLRVLPNNPRTITQAKLNQLCDSIRENGFYAHRALAVEPIPGTPDYYVLDGNQRKKALARLKRKAAPCIIYTDLTEEERARLVLMGNINVKAYVSQQNAKNAQSFLSQFDSWLGTKTSRKQPANVKSTKQVTFSL